MIFNLIVTINKYQINKKTVSLDHLFRFIYFDSFDWQEILLNRVRIKQNLKKQDGFLVYEF